MPILILFNSVINIKTPLYTSNESVLHFVNIDFIDLFFQLKDLRLGCVYIPIKLYKDSLHRCRVKCYILASLWKIGVTFGFAFLLVPNLALIQNAFGDLLFTSSQFPKYPIDVVMDDNSKFAPNVTIGPIEVDAARGPVFLRPIRESSLRRAIPDLDIDYQNCTRTNVTVGGPKNETLCKALFISPNRWNELGTYLPAIAQIVCSGLCYYFGRLACKLCMQRISFAIPLSLATPLSVAILITVRRSHRSDHIPTFTYVYKKQPYFYT